MMPRLRPEAEVEVVLPEQYRTRPQAIGQLCCRTSQALNQRSRIQLAIRSAMQLLMPLTRTHRLKRGLVRQQLQTAEIPTIRQTTIMEAAAEVLPARSGTTEIIPWGRRAAARQ